MGGTTNAQRASHEGRIAKLIQAPHVDDTIIRMVETEVSDTVIGEEVIEQTIPIQGSLAIKRCMRKMRPRRSSCLH